MKKTGRKDKTNKNMTGKLFALELKTALRTIPGLCLGSFLLLLLMGVFAFCGSLLLYHQAPLPQITISFVSEDSSALSTLAVDFISGMESTKDLFLFRQMTEKEAYAALESGQAAAVVLLPPGLAESILAGSNPPVQIILPPSSGLSSLLLQELTSAGAKTLSSAQAGIYTITDLYVEHDLKAYLQESYHALNALNLQYALARDRIFRPVTTSPTGGLSTAAYYGLSSLLTVFMLFGTTCSSFLGSRPTAFQAKLRTCSISGSSYLLARLLSIFVFFTCIASFILMLLTALWGIFQVTGGAFLSDVAITTNMAALLRPESILTFLNILLFVSAFNLLIYQIGQSPGGCILLLFFGSMLLLFLSGAFIPIAFFPQNIRRFTCLLPTTAALRLLGGILLGSVSAFQNALLLCHSLLCILLSLLLNHLHQKREG